MQSGLSPSGLSPSGMQRRLAFAVLESLRQDLEWRDCDGCGLVLDVGCGTGDVTARELLPRLPIGVRVVATDPDCATLAYAASRFDGPRLCFLQLDIATRRLRDTGVWRLGPYLKVFSFCHLQWVQQQTQAIQNISELLCSGGEAALTLISRTELYSMYESLSKSPRWSNYLKDYKQSLSAYQYSENPTEELKTYLEQAGFTVKGCGENEIVYVTDTMEEVKEMLVAVNPFFSRIPKDKQEAFLEDCEEEAFRSGSLIARPPSGAGTMTYLLIYKALVAHAVKSQTA